MGHKKRATWYSFITFRNVCRFLSLLDSAVNQQQGSCHIYDRTLNVSLHYLVNYKRSTIAILLYLDVFNSITDLLMNISIKLCVLLNAQNAILWHKHTPKDVCATNTLHHRWHFVPSNTWPLSDAASVHQRHELECSKCFRACIRAMDILAFSVTREYTHTHTHTHTHKIKFIWLFC